MSDCRLIVIYDNCSEIDELSRFNDNINVSPVIIASFNAKFLNQIDHTYPDYETFLIEERPINIFDVSNEVIQIIKAINASIQKHIDPENILHFQRHIEGGYTSSKVQELVIIEKLISRVSKRYSIKKIFDYSDVNYLLESELFKVLARHNSISYRRISGHDQKLAIIRYRLKPYLYEPFRLLKYIRNNSYCNKTSPIASKNSIVLCLESSAAKFLELYSSFCKNLEAINIPYYYLTSSINRNDTRIKGIYDKMYVLENYESLSDYWISIIKTLHFAMKYFKRRKKILGDISHQNSLIGSQLLKTIYYHIIIDTGHRYRYRESMIRYLKENNQNIMAIKLWGETSLVQGEILCDIIRTLFPRIKTLGFEVGIGLKTYPYISQYMNKVDYYITSNDIETEVYLTYGVCQDKILQLIDFKHRMIVSKQKELVTKSNSKRILGISDGYSLFVLFDISIALRGYQRFSDILDIISIIPILAQKHKNILFLVKPHPRFKHHAYLENMNRYSNVQLFSRHISIMHLINVSDIVVTKTSAIGHEALLFSKLLISIIDDDRMKVYLNSAIYLNDVQMLSNIFKDYHYYKNTYQSHIRKYNELMTNGSNGINIQQAINIIKGDSHDRKNLS